MLKKFLKEVVIIIVGKQAEDIVDLLDTKKYVNEFIISKKLDLTINQTRNILYKISDHGLVSSIRKKDKKKGWYTYFWKIEALKSLEFLKADLIKKINMMDSQINSRETKRFYICDGCHIEMSEENSLLYNFTCSECGSVFTLKDNTKTLKEMKRVVERLKGDLALVENEIEIESKKVNVVKQRAIKKEEKERDDKKKLAKEIRALARKKVNKNAGKKAVKKKVVKKKKAVKKIVKKSAKGLASKIKKVVKKVSNKKKSDKKRS
ncbi:MAG: hypothetical protein KKC19_03635 [Nanoarchaeota archaeon]|nr:hypothetical protein [Nanoarchaeota archaeon]